MWFKLIAGTFLVATAIVGVLRKLASDRWLSLTRQIHGKLESGRLAARPTRYDPGELAGLPAPVQRFFHASLRSGQPLIEAVNVEHTGTFNLSETGENWKSFRSTQRFITRRPGFDWEARIDVLPGLPVYVHDAYVTGDGLLRAALLGVVPLADMHGTPEVAQGELMRFFAEAAWYPTALLPSQGVRWEAVDDSSASATLTDGDLSVTLLFRFHENGMISSVRAEARGRMTDGRVIQTPWEGRWFNDESRGDIRIPLEGEVAWILPDGPKPYWRGRITKIAYEFAM